MRFYMMLLLCALLILMNKVVAAQPKTDSLLLQLFAQSKDSLLGHVTANKDSFRLQVIYTQINRDKHNIPSFYNYCFNVDTNLYFNPASTVKLPLAFLSLEKLHRMKAKGIDKFTRIQIDSNETWESPVTIDSTSEDYYPSIAHYIKKAFLISDNDAYNRMYQFVGQQSINRILHAKGYPSTRITRQFLGLNADQNRHTNAIRFLDPTGRLIYLQPPACNTDSFFTKEVKIGKQHYNASDSLVNAPIDFSKANNLPLEDLQQLLQTVLFPASVPAYRRFDLGKDDYEFLLKYLSQYPSETSYPKYDTAQYYDSYVKFYFRDSTHNMPENVRVFNKVGWAYGFLTDVSYVMDSKNKVEFMLTATVYVNSDGVLNDNAYDYEKVGWPFMYQLGQTIYHYELQRKGDNAPRFGNLHIEYDRRDPGDKRHSIKDADN